MSAASRKPITLVILTTILMSVTSCARVRVLDVGPVFVTSDPNDIDMHYVAQGSLIIDPCDPDQSIRTGKDGRWVSNKFFTYLLTRVK